MIIRLSQSIFLILKSSKGIFACSRIPFFIRNYSIYHTGKISRPTVKSSQTLFQLKLDFYHIAVNLINDPVYIGTWNKSLCHLRENASAERKQRFTSSWERVHSSKGDQ